MTTTNKASIREYAVDSLDNITAFARFVNYAESLSQSDALFESDKHKADYQDIWFELEIINALALAQWEEEGCPASWKAQWESGYKHDASCLINILLDLLK